MNITSLEVKTRINDHQEIEAYLKAKNALYTGEDHLGIDQKEGIDQSYSLLMHSMPIHHAP